MAFLGKTGLILSAGMLLAGGILFSVGAANGGREQVQAMAANGELSIGGFFYSSHNAHNYATECAPMVVEDIGVIEEYRLSADSAWEREAAITYLEEEEQEWWEHGGVKIAKKDEIQKLEIEWNTNFSIYLIDSDYFLIEDGGTNSYKVDGDTIKISPKRSDFGECILYIPEDWVGKEIDLSIGSGSIYAQSLHADKVEIDVGNGYMEGTSIITDQFDVKVSSGVLNLNELQTKDAEIEIGLGTAEIMYATITGDLDVDCGMGGLILYLTGTQLDHNYKVSSTGTLNIGDYSHSGFHADYEINNHVSSNFKIKCGLGSIDIYFE